MNKKQKGFTLVEVVVVMAVIGILVAIIVPSYKHYTSRAKEAVLKENLFILRDALNKFYQDKNKYPTSLDDLITHKYLRKIPMDPMTKSYEWEIVHFEPDEMEDFDPELLESIIDIKSKAEGTGYDGTPFKDW